MEGLLLDLDEYGTVVKHAAVVAGSSLAEGSCEEQDECRPSLGEEAGKRLDLAETRRITSSFVRGSCVLDPRMTLRKGIVAGRSLVGLAMSGLVIGASGVRSAYATAGVLAVVGAVIAIGLKLESRPASPSVQAS